MADAAFWSAVVARVRETTGIPFEPLETSSLGGGCINAAARMRDVPSGTSYFVKRNRASLAHMFAAEADALAEIAATHTIRVPQPICTGVADDESYLVLEFIELHGSRSAKTETAMGAQLAALHRSVSPDSRFGWHRDNTIGSTPQHNPWTDEWPAFFAAHRLRFQLDLAEKNGRTFSSANTLLDRVPSFFASYTPIPSLLHGDLWGGNAAADSAGNPVLFDPASYYGDREADLAFTEMFGGFGPRFYEAYNEAFPLDEGYCRRKELYNLYHVLNHFNLFGGGYGSQAENLISRLAKP